MTGHIPVSLCDKVGLSIEHINLHTEWKSPTPARVSNCQTVIILSKNELWLLVRLCTIASRCCHFSMTTSLVRIAKASTLAGIAISVT